VKQAAYARTYEVVVAYEGGSLTVSLTTPNGKEATDGKDVDTDVIAQGLFAGPYPVSSSGASNGALITAAHLRDLTSAGFTVSLAGGVIYLSHPSKNFTVTTEDGQGGAALIAVKDRVQSFSDLPKKGPVSGFVVRITQQTGNEEDDFYVAWRETAGGGTGVWEESIAPGVNLGADPQTLPVSLVYLRGTNSWAIGLAGWTGRTTGDENLAPNPGFIGTQLRDITYWRGRIVLLYPEGALFSSATDLLRLYPSTLTQVPDDDAFERVNPLAEEASFYFAVPFKKILILFGETGQAQVTTAGQPLTPSTANCEPYASYESLNSVRPQPSNDRLYFAAPRGKAASAIYEMEVTAASSSDLAEGDDMTVSIPRYLPPNLDYAATCAVNYLTAYGVSGGDSLYPHLYRYADRKRVQNAWCRWPLPQGDALGSMFFVNTLLYLLVRRGSQVHLLSMDVADGVTDAGASFSYLLDRKVTQAALVCTYDPVADRTRFTFPYILSKAPTLVVSSEGAVAGPVFNGSPLPAPRGTVAEVLSWGGQGCTLEGDWRHPALVAGEEYSGEFTLSRIYYRDPQGLPNRTGKLRLSKITFELDRTVSLQVGVKVGGRQERIYQFESTLADTPGLETDEVNLYSGDWSVPIGGYSEAVTIRVIYPGWAPAGVLGWTWEGEINPRAMRMQGGGR
jgi:hypothetical protein